MTRIAHAFGISRSHLAASSKVAPISRGPYSKLGDEDALTRIRRIVNERPSYGYRRVAARLRREMPDNPVNHKRTYRLMKTAGLLLPRHGERPERVHDGKVMTTASNQRWCSDCFVIRCWNGEHVHVAFSLDCCDREAIAWVAADRYLDAYDIRDLMALSVEARFSSVRTPHAVEWLSDNGPPYTANETRFFGASSGLRVLTTPSYSPESNGMAEAFVHSFKRDYVYVNDVDDARTVLEALPRWFADYNEHHPHKSLKMQSPRQFRRALQPANPCPV